MKINRSKYALLGILNYHSFSGYDIKKAIDNSISNFWSEDFGRIYPELIQMEKGGLVTRAEAAKESGLNRKTYEITEKGKAEFGKWILSPIEGQPVRNELLLKIFFGKADMVDNIIQKIEQEKRENEMILKKYEQINEKLTDDKGSETENNSPFWAITLQYGKYKAEAVLKWCEESLKALYAMKENINNRNEEKS